MTHLNILTHLEQLNLHRNDAYPFRVASAITNSNDTRFLNKPYCILWN
jgi:hypothetical protein